MRLTTAGESHGVGLFAIVEGLPAHLRIDTDVINTELALRQHGFGRGARQKIEKDCVEILCGVRGGVTLGSPVALAVKNADYQNWADVMAVSEAVWKENSALERAVTAVRPGHADLAGVMKFAQTDARNVLERASARETAVRVAAGGIFKQYLAALGVEIGGCVREICGVKDEKEYSFAELCESKKTELGILDEEVSLCAKQKIEELFAVGDTAGGVVEVRVKGLKSGFGSPMTYAEKLDGRLAGALMGVQAVKGVEIGGGFSAAGVRGSEFHDEIFYEDGRGFFRKTNRAGGIEGGTSNGEEIVVRVAMKPLPTLKKGLKTVDIVSKESSVAAKERADVCAVFALMVVAEAVVAEVIASAVAERLGGDYLEEVIERYQKLP